VRSYLRFREDSDSMANTILCKRHGETVEGSSCTKLFDMIGCSKLNHCVNLPRYPCACVTTVRSVFGGRVWLDINEHNFREFCFILILKRLSLLLWFCILDQLSWISWGKQHRFWSRFETRFFFKSEPPTDRVQNLRFSSGEIFSLDTKMKHSLPSNPIHFLFSHSGFTWTWSFGEWST
jgi:hypothetical protein